MSFLLDTVNEIVPHLYLTNWKSSNSEQVMEKYKIMGVITVEMLDKPQQTIKYYNQQGIQNLHIRLNDTPEEDISKYFDQTYTFINNFINKGENVLVHCRAGVSRSATVVINYIMKKKYENEIVTSNPQQVLNEVVEFVRSKRVFINPNSGFMNQLLNYSEKYFKIVVWPLSISDILPSGDLRNTLTSVVIFNLVYNNIPAFEKYEHLASLLKPHNIKVYGVYRKANYTQYSSDDDEPFIVGMYKGKFFSEYGLDTTNIKVYGDLQDLKQFGLDLGTNVVIHEKI